MKNVDVLRNFINGDTQGKTKNLYIDGNKLFNYDTCIAERWEKIDGKEYGFAVNVTKYSKSTTVIQNELLHMLENEHTVCLANLPIGVGSLIAEE